MRSPFPSSRSYTPHISPVLCVDMDGTLLATDILWESILALIRSKPYVVFLLPFWLFKGKAEFKWEIARRVRLDVATLPYRQEVLDFLSEEHRSGREIVLATASDQTVASAVANFLGLFNTVLASHGSLNLSGRTKLEAIKRHVGSNGFDYIGNSTVDLPIWKEARQALVVSRSSGLLRRVSKQSSVSRVFSTENRWFIQILKALRVHQWTKNLLVFVPLIVGHKVTDLDMLLGALWGFLAFNFCASSAYVLNDLLDLEADRQHPYKRNRPFASGALGIDKGVIAVPLLLALGFAVAASRLSFLFGLELFAYFIVTLAYSFWIKRVAILDVLTLAGLYSVRVLAGGAATGIPISPWLLAFSGFLFLSLAFMKRYAELRMIQERSGVEAKGRDYNVGDIELLRSSGPASGLLCILVLALYINSPEVVLLYQSPLALWLIEPILLYWIMRLWLLAHRGAIAIDPIVFTAKDPVSYLVGALVLAVILLASFF